MLARLFLVAMLGFLVLSALMRTRDESIGPINHALTEEECSACHMAYQAAMLPSKSWTRLMNSLDSHFGEDASLDEESLTTIAKHLRSNSADSSWMGNRFSRGQTNEWSIRITESDHWLREHKNISFKNSVSFEDILQTDCLACHDNAEKGDFRVDDA